MILSSLAELDIPSISP